MTQEMFNYLFIGKVLPERAQLSFILPQIVLKKEENEISVDVSIILNQVSVKICSANEWDIFDLRNVVKTLLLNQLAALGFLKGYAYELDIARVLAADLNIDQVFGIEIPLLELRGKSVELGSALPELLTKASGPDGRYINRCLNDLVLSMKHADDTAFYCYRAIESLKLHSAIRANLQLAKDSDQWSQFRTVAKCDRETIEVVKAYADPIRHGGISDVTSEQRAKIFKTTWDVVAGYLAAI